MSERDRAANVLGALSVAIADQMTKAVAGPAGLPASAAAALSALHHFLDRPTIDQLRQVLGLTPSGAVRLVDRLAEAGLVTRERGADARSRSILLTPEGRRAATELSMARARLLDRLLGGLSPAERATLHGLMGRMMENLVGAKDGGAWVCRLCDLEACGRAEGYCPAANAAAARYGVRPPNGGASIPAALPDAAPPSPSSTPAWPAHPE